MNSQCIYLSTMAHDPICAVYTKNVTQRINLKPLESPDVNPCIFLIEQGIIKPQVTADHGIYHTCSHFMSQILMDNAIKVF